MDNLRRRLHMTRSMQIYGVSSLLLCVVCTLLIYIGLQKTAVYTFGAALGLLVVSLWISIRELLISSARSKCTSTMWTKRGSKDRTGPNVPGTEAARKSAPARNRKLGPSRSKATVANHSTGGTSINSTRVSLNARSEKSDMPVTPARARRPRVVPAVRSLPSTTNT